jgi:hypothetical protein
MQGSLVGRDGTGIAPRGHPTIVACDRGGTYPSGAPVRANPSSRLTTHPQSDHLRRLVLLTLYVWVATTRPPFVRTCMVY